MKICFLADAGSVNTRSWANGFAELLGHDVHVVSVNRTGEFASSVTLHHVGTDVGTQSTGGKLGYLMYLGRIRRIVRDIAPDLVVGYRVASYGYVAAMTGFHPIVVVAQGQYIVAPRHSRAKQYFVGKALKSADLVHSWAPHVTRKLEEFGADPGKILTQHRGIDLTVFTEGSDRGDAPPSVAATRGLSRWYRVDVVVRAIALARGQVDGLTGTIAGTGPAEEELRELVGELGADDFVRFAGSLPHAELPHLLHESSIYVSAVPTDGVSASLLEAMATGCFPIVRENDANRHWVEHGVNGYLVAVDDPREYAECIVSAARDGDMRRAAIEMNRRIVEERGDLSQNMRTIERAYLDLVESREGRKAR